MRKVSVIVFVFFLSATAIAMTCESTPVVQRTRDNEDSPVFVGRVVLLDGSVTRDADGKEYGYSAEMQIEKRLWGIPKEVPERVKVVSLESIRWTVGAEYLVAGIAEISKRSDGWEVGVGPCTSSRLLQESRVGLRTVEEGFCDKPGSTIVGQLWVNGDGARKPIPRMMVWLSDQKGKVTISTTDDDGIYAAHHLPPGSYQIRAAVPANFTVVDFRDREWDLQEAGECVDGSLEFTTAQANAGNSP